MEFTNEEMVKSLTSLIDETLEEIEEIKKSKFAASEISLGDKDSGMAGKSKNGNLEAKKSEDEEDKDEDKEMDKAESCEDKESDEDEKKKKKEAEMSKKEDDDKKDKKEDEDKKEDMKKSLKESEDLVKSYVDGKMNSIEEKLSKMAAAIQALAEAPVQRRGVPAGVAPLHKSTADVEPLSKTELANKLFELKKSGQPVDSSDVFRVETGNQATAFEIANKYGLR
jgi:hypothetical protein